MDVTIHGITAYDYVSAVTLPEKGRSEFREKRRMDDRDSGSALLKEISVIVGAQCRARRHRHGTNFHGAEVRRRELRDVREHQQYSLFLLQS